MINKAKSAYYINAINEIRNQPKKLWSILNNLGVYARCKTKCSSAGLSF